MKKIITHLNPDLDAVASVWLLKRFLPGWEEAKVSFVSTSRAKDVDQDSKVLYVDVGLGKLDHHQTGEYTSATKLCWGFIQTERKGKEISPLEVKSLNEIVKVVTQVDNARDLDWEEVNQGRYQFYLHSLIDSLRGLGWSDERVMEFGLNAMDAVLLNFKHKIRAEEELKEGIKFETPWGKGIGVESGNKHVIWRGEARGYALVVMKYPDDAGVRIYSRPDSGADLTQARDQFKKLDPESDWFLHATRRLLLNQSNVNPDLKPTKLTLKEVIEVLKK